MDEFIYKNNEIDFDFQETSLDTILHCEDTKLITFKDFGIKNNYLSFDILTVVGDTHVAIDGLNFEDNVYESKDSCYKYCHDFDDS